MIAKYKVFKSTQEAAEFITAIGKNDMISVYAEGDVLVVWYWDNQRG